MRVRVERASVKDRKGGSLDDRRDVGVLDLRGRAWNGIVPVRARFCAPVAAGDKLVGRVPGYIGEWVERANRVAEGYAMGESLQEKHETFRQETDMNISIYR